MTSPVVVHVVDTVEVAPACLDEYLRIVESDGIGVMTDAGARFVACWTTAKDLGEPVRVEVTWEADDHEHWNTVRKNLVLDPRWYAYGDRLAALRSRGTRRFFYPTRLGAPPV